MVDTVAVGSGVVMPTAGVLAISTSPGETAVSGWINVELYAAITTSHTTDYGWPRETFESTYQSLHDIHTNDF